jgi:eukaryotic-like serine/threonine-protein kinase
MIGSYRVLSKLGEGGMGEVFLAEDERLQRQVAIKRLLPSTAVDEQAARRLLTEARAAGRIDHPNICSVYEVGEDNGAPFIVMPVVEGSTLASQLQAGPLPIAAAVSIAAQAADALDAAHRQGILHRDIKPANLMIGARSHVRVMDFGVATIAGPASAETVSKLTLPGAVLGTIAYMSPEQARGDQLDARSDLFSLGVVLFEMLSGTRPFDRTNTIEGLSALLTEPAPPLGNMRPDAPAELQRIVAKALQKSRDDRYQSAADMHVDLRNLLRALESGTSQAMGVTPTAPRGRSWIVAVAAIGVIALGVAVWSLTGNRADPVPPTPAAASIDGLAVLPFTNNTGDNDKEYVADGIAQTLASSLSRLPNLKVISRNSAFAFKGKTNDLKAIAKQLGVSAVMTGTVGEADGKTVIDIELSNANDGSLILTHRYIQAAGSSVLAMQSEIAQDVVDRLQLKVSGDDQRQLAEVATTNAQAYQRYLKGVHFARRGTPPSLHQAIGEFKEAVALDSNYAQAYAGAAGAYLELGLFYEAPNDAMPKARAFANEALERDPDLPQARIALGVISLMYDWDWDAAAKVITANAAWSRAALEMFSCSAHLLQSTGRIPEAEQELRRALVADPLSPILKAELGCGSYYRRKYDAAIAENLDALELDPGYITAYWGLGRAYGQKKEYQKALDELNKVEPRTGVAVPLITAEIAYALGKSGRTAEARALLARLKAAAKTEFVDPYLLATVHVALGDTAATLSALEEAYAARSGFMVSLDEEPKWDDIRANPRFKDLLKRVGF